MKISINGTVVLVPLLLLLLEQKFSSFSLFVSAEYPAPLVWKTSEHCPEGYDYCGGLEFCSRGDNPYDRQYGYRLSEQDTCSFPGPLIRLQAGYKYKFTLRNTSLDPTNIHTHGLHIVGDGDSDDITRRVDGKGRFGNPSQDSNCLDYTWDLRPDHPGGTYWYHSHYHGLSLQQVNGGAFGMLLVEDNVNLNPNVPKYLTTNEILLQISSHDDGNVYGNGNLNEKLSLTSDEWYRLRMSIVNPNAKLQDIVFHKNKNDETLECQVHQVASDGIWSSQVPLNLESQSTFHVTGASRADFAIQCPSLDNNGQDGGDDVILYDITYGGQAAATLQVASSSSSQTISQRQRQRQRQLEENNVFLKDDLEVWIPNRPESLQLMDSPLLTPEDEQNTLTISMTSQTINGEYYDPLYPLAELQYNQVYEWTLRNTHNHPFHLHLYHMKIVTPGGCGVAHAQGEFYDTISASLDEEEDSTSTECKVQFKTADFGQRCVMHCHTMEHGDNGSMAWVNVTGSSDMPLNEVISPQYKCTNIDAGPMSESPSALPTSSPTLTPYTVSPSSSPSVLPTITKLSESPTFTSAGGSQTVKPTVTPNRKHTIAPSMTSSAATTRSPTVTRRSLCAFWMGVTLGIGRLLMIF